MGTRGGRIVTPRHDFSRTRSFSNGEFEILLFGVKSRVTSCVYRAILAYCRGEIQISGGSMKSVHACRAMLLGLFLTLFPVVPQSQAATTIQTYSSTNFNLAGSATESSNEITLTTATGNQAGAIFSKSRISVSDSFTVLAEMYFGTNNGGADGIAFVLQPNTSSSLSTGGGLGYAGIDNAFAIEFDTWQNTNDLANDHSGLMKETATNHTEWTGTDSQRDLGNIEDGLWHKVEIYWLPAGTTSGQCNAGYGNLDVYFDINGDGDVSDTVSGQSEQLYDHCLQLESYFSGSNASAYYGFTAATGGANNLQKVRSLNNEVVLRTNTPPTISTIPNQTVLVNSGQKEITFTITDDSTTPAQWAEGDSIVSSNTTAVPTVSLVTPYPNSTGSAATFTLRLTPSTTAVGTSTITVTFVDGDGTQVSTTFTVDVVTSLGITQPSSLLTFATNGADNNSYPQSEIKGTTAKLWKNVLTRAGYTFTGWNTKADGTGTSYADQASFNFDADFITLYAQWSLIKSTPTLTWANPAYITTATPLSATQLNATASVPGTCTYTPALGATLPAGKQTLTCLFTPTDTTKYSTVSKSVEIEVLAIPTLTWANPAAIKSGTALSATQLNATASLPGRFEYSPDLGFLPAAGKQKLTVVFIPTDSRLSKVTKEVEVEITPALLPNVGSITTTSGSLGSVLIRGITSNAKIEIRSLGYGLTSANVIGLSLEVTSKLDYSGKTTVVITVNDEARSVDLTVPVTVNPAAVSSGIFTISSSNTSVVNWSAAVGANRYQVTSGSSVICSSSTTSCQISHLLGPASTISVTALGGDTTSSAAKSLTYSNPATPIEITSVNFATAKSTLTKSARNKLNAFASQVSALGLNTLVIQGHTDSVGGIDNQALSNARAQAAAKYLRSKLANVKITVKGFGPNDPIADNNSDEGRAQNRRAGVYIGG